MSVIMAWLVNSVIVAAVLAAGAAAWEVSAGWSGRAARWGWIAALAGSVGLPLVLRLIPARGWSEAVPVGVPMLTLDPVVLTAQAQAGGWTMVDTGLAAWLLATVLMLGYIAGIVLQLARARAGWRETEVEGGKVFVTRNTGPAALGVRRGMVVVPAWVLALDADLRTLLLRHEREHLRAGDPRLLLGGLLLVAAMPWNPVLWLQLLRLRNAIELDCDSRVLAGGGDPGRYGSLLLEVGRQRGRSAVVMATFAEPRVFLKQRIQRIAGWPLERRPIRAAAFTAVALLLFVSALSARDPLRGALAGTTDPASEVSPPVAADGMPMVVDTPPTGPHFTPMTVRPELLNRDDVQRALIAYYPPLLRDAGIGGTPRLWFYIDEQGVVARTVLKNSSGYPELDAAAGAVGRVMRFKPALNRDRTTAVWVEIPIVFDAGGDTGEGIVVAGRRGTPVGASAPRPRVPAAQPGVPVQVPARARGDISAAPTFTPMTDRPNLINLGDVQRALVRSYPPLLRDAGKGGAPAIWFLIDEQGRVAKTQLSKSSGFRELDEAAL
ncbi:MAG: TonB family protein, partial [Gemmatimonadota bacterium]